MKRLVVYSISLLFFFQISLFAYSSNPKDFINELVNDAITKLSDKNLTDDQKKTLIEKINKEIVSFLLKSGLPSSSEQISEEKNVNSNQNLQTSRPENTTNNSQQKQQQKAEPVRVEQKAGRNEKVTITNGRETKELKWKKAKPLVESGKWTRV